MKVFILLAALVAAVAAQNCGPSQFECDNGNCIPGSYQCDFDNDCGDFSDEFNCPCDSTDFVCENTICIPDFWICDGYTDCSEGEDEKDCPCPTGETHCADGSQCVKEEYWCDADGIWDCFDGSDEKNCTVATTTTEAVSTTELPIESTPEEPETTPAPRRVPRLHAFPKKSSMNRNKIHTMKARRARLMK